MQNNFTDLINFKEDLYIDAKKRDLGMKNYFKNLLKNTANSDDEDPELEKKRKDLVTFEAMFATYMNIMNITKLKDARDPIALLSMHMDAIYPNRPYLKEDDRVYRFCVSFKHKTVSFINNQIDLYDEYTKNYPQDKMFLIEKDNKIFNITLNPKMTLNTKNRFNLYINFINGELSNVPYMGLTKDRCKYTTNKDFEGDFNPNIIDKSTNTKGKSNIKLLINGLENFSSSGTKIPKKMRDRADEYHKYADNNGRLIELLNEENIKRKQIDKQNGIDFTLSNIDINNNELYDIGMHFSKVKNNLKIFPVKSIDGKEVVLFNDDEQVNLSKQEFQIIGPTGSGKSVSIEALLFDMMKKNTKVLYVCTEVSQAVTLMKRMMNLAKINNEENLPIPYLNIGQDKHKYELDFIIEQIRNNDTELANSITACNVMLDPINKAIFKQLNSSCFLKDNLGFYKAETTKGKNNKIDYKPCHDLKVGDSKKWCSLYSECGNHERYKIMNEATLWITTNASLFSSSIPLQWDKHKSSVLDTSLIHADVVIVDEADAIEEDSDSRLLETVLISKEKPRGAFDYDAVALIDAIRTHSTYLKKSSISTLISNMLSSTDIAYKVDNVIYNNFRYISEDIKKKWFLNTFTPESLLKEWLSLYTFKTKAHPDQINKNNNSHNSDTDFNHILNKALIETDRLLKLDEYLSWAEEAEKSNNMEGELESRVNPLIEAFMERLKVTSSDGENKVRTNTLKYRAENKEPSSEMLYLFENIFLINKLKKLVSKGILPYVPEFRYSLDAEPDARSIEQSLQRINGVNRHYQYTPEMPIDITGFKYTEKKRKTNSEYELSMTVCFGIGREVLRNANRCLSAIYNCRPAQILYTSATSRAEGSSLYNINCPVTAVIRNRTQDKQKVNVNIERYYIDDEIFFLSGTHPDYIKSKLCEFTTSYLGKENELLHRLSKQQKEIKLHINESTPITLILTNSYKQADWVGDSLARTNWIDESEIAILYSPSASSDFKENSHITKNELQRLYSKNKRVLIAPIDAIARGFNILRGPNSDKSLISDIVFMFRPYPSPEDHLSMTSLITHKLKSDYMVKNKKANREGYEAYEYIKNESQQLYRFLQDANSWSKIGDAEKRSIAINQLVSKVVQAIGRGRRGGTDVNVYFVDGALCGLEELEITKSDLLKNKKTMIYYWIEFLNREDTLTDCVYKNIKEGFNNLTINIHKF